MRDFKKLVALIKAYAVEPYQEFILEEIQPSIRLKTTGNPCPELGKTKLGGHPDLPKSINWATSHFDDTYLSFLGQVNLEEVKEFDEQALLPQKGILYFFFNLNAGDDGKVLFSEDIHELERAAPPEGFEEKKKSFFKRLLTGKAQKRVLKESEVEIYKEYGFPSWDSLRLERIQNVSGTDILPIDAFKEGIFEARYEEGETETTSNHHLIGHYQGIQNEFHELNIIDFKVNNPLEIMEIEKALKWKLLFQFDSDDHLEISWGDWGRIYFFIHEEDLKNRNFANVKVSADCY